MLNFALCAIKTETIIGIVAIVIIVISLGLIVATAIRNYLLHKKSVGNGLFVEPPACEEEGVSEEEVIADSEQAEEENTQSGLAE